MKSIIEKYYRKIIQVSSMVLYNLNINGFKTNTIYQGNMKAMCVPGLNCYSCPGAIASCPLGALQQSIKIKKIWNIYYVVGLLILFGVFLGRTICGFLCPFGLVQDFLYKIQSRKIHKNNVTMKLSIIKYIILIVFVISLPFIKKDPSFCKYICPVGTLEGGVFLVLFNDTLRKMIGFLFSIKIILLIIILLLCVLIYRMFCRFVCPLGAIYSLFNKINVVGIKYDKSKCTHCGRCISICKMDIKEVGDRECISCNECIKECPEKIITFGINKKED